MINNNRLTIPPEIGQLENLRELHLNENKLTSIPSEIGQLTNLQKFFLDYNALTSLPPEIGQLTNLQVLFLSENKLTSLPPEIGQLKNLEYLSLGENKFDKKFGVIRDSDIKEFLLNESTLYEIKQLENLQKSSSDNLSTEPWTINESTTF
jgi:Leucine-rich repeat (LRR) protein